MRQLNRLWASVITAGIFTLAVAFFAETAQADPAAGKALFDANGCNACHIVSGPVEAVPIAERSAIKGPPLWFAGSKFKDGWIAGWLAEPTPIRRVKYNTLEIGSNDHVALSAEDAGNVAEYLMTLKDDEMATGVVAEGKLNRRKKFSAEKLFTKKQVCFGCHQYSSKRGDIGGFAGPSMVGAGSRLNPDWVFALIQNRERYFPNGRMPVYGDEAFNKFSEDEFKLLAQFIGGM
ncbi:MAG: c-type cytochrome [Sphingomonadales bacterium]